REMTACDTSRRRVYTCPHVSTERAPANMEPDCSTPRRPNDSTCQAESFALASAFLVRLCSGARRLPMTVPAADGGVAPSMASFTSMLTLARASTLLVTALAVGLGGCADHSVLLRPNQLPDVVSALQRDPRRPQRIKEFGGPEVEVTGPLEKIS